MKRAFSVLFLLLTLMAAKVHAAETATLPATVMEQTKEPLAVVGSAVYRKLGFRIYRVTLWAPNGVYSPDRPYALELRYARSLSKDTIVDSVNDSLRDDETADDATLERWAQKLNDVMPAVEEGDQLTGLALPGKHSTLFFNNATLTTLEDPAFSRAFFGIWLSDKADPDMRAALLGQSQR